MRIAVEYLAQIKRAAGVVRETTHLPDHATLENLLISLAATRDEAFRELLLDRTGRPHRSLLFFVDGASVGPSHTLKDGDLVSVLAPMAGG